MSPVIGVDCNGGLVSVHSLILFNFLFNADSEVAVILVSVFVKNVCQTVILIKYVVIDCPYQVTNCTCLEMIVSFLSQIS